MHLNIQQLIYFVSYIFRAEVPHEYQVAPGSLTLLPTEHTQASLANGILYTEHTPSILLSSYWKLPKVFVCALQTTDLCAQSLSCVWLFSALWTGAHQTPLSMWIFRQEHWSGWPFPSPVDLPDPGIEPPSPVSPALHTDSLPAEPWRKPKFIYM